MTKKMKAFWQRLKDLGSGLTGLLLVAAIISSIIWLIKRNIGIQVKQESEAEEDE